MKVLLLTVWSTLGTALLVTLLPGMPLSDMVGAYITDDVLFLLIGWSESFDRPSQYISRSVTLEMMTGILFQFGTQAFNLVVAEPLLGGGILLSCLVFRRAVLAGWIFPIRTRSRQLRTQCDQ